MTYIMAVSLKQALIKKLNEGLFDLEEWRCVIDEMKEAGYPSMAGDLQRRCDHYAKLLSRETDG